MILTHKDDSSHPFEYAWIIGIFHIDAIYNKEGVRDGLKPYDILWVRWYHGVTSYHAGFERKHLQSGVHSIR